MAWDSDEAPAHGSLAETTSENGLVASSLAWGTVASGLLAIVVAGVPDTAGG